MTTTTKRATVRQLRDFFEASGGRKVTMRELKDLKAGDGRDYDHLATGIGNGTLTY